MNIDSPDWWASMKPCSVADCFPMQKKNPYNVFVIWKGSEGLVYFAGPTEKFQLTEEDHKALLKGERIYDELSGYSLIIIGDELVVQNIPFTRLGRIPLADIKAGTICPDRVENKKMCRH